MMTNPDLLKKIAGELIIKANTVIPEDVAARLENAYQQETCSGAKSILNILQENAKIAKQQRRVLCQDNGVPVFYVKTSDLSMIPKEIRAVLFQAVEQASRELPLRSLVVHPIKRTEDGLNTGTGVPIINFEFGDDHDYLEITFVPKGAGSGSWAKVAFLDPVGGEKSIKKFVIDSVIAAGGNPCPPVIIGVGIGGTIEEAAKLAAKATIRPLNEKSNDREIALLEERLLQAVNMTGIGTMGLGGDVTALAVNIEYAYTHKPWLPVAVFFQCWSGRRATAKIYANGDYLVF